MFWPWMKRLSCPVLPPALFQEKQASCENVNCLSPMHGYIFLLYLYLLNKDRWWETYPGRFTFFISRTSQKENSLDFMFWVCRLLPLTKLLLFSISYIFLLISFDGMTEDIPQRLTDSLKEQKAFISKTHFDFGIDFPHRFLPTF